MFTGSRSTLLLFLWVFFVGAGILNIYDLSTYISDATFVSPWDYISGVQSVIYVVVGLLLALKIDSILPKYRHEAVRGIWALFVAETLFVIAYTIQSLNDPGMIDPAITAKGFDTFMLLVSFATIAFNFLIYKIVTDSINIVAGMKPRRQSTWETFAYWGVLLLFFGWMLGYILWDPVASEFNVL